MDLDTIKSSSEYHVHIEESIATLQVPHPPHDPVYFLGRDIYQALKLGLRKEEIYAFGDYLNDIEMLEFAGTSVAMGNAPDIVKNAAKFVTPDVDDDGIWHGVRMVGLL
jgi:hypothetical protein